MCIDLPLAILSVALKEKIKENAIPVPSEPTGEVQVNYFDEIQKAIKAAKNVTDTDAVWNQYAETIKTLPDAQAKALDKIYLAHRDTIGKSQPAENNEKLI